MADVTTTGLPPGPWTVDDLESFPDDGLRYELVDGTLLVPAGGAAAESPARGRVSFRLEVFGLPLDVRVSETRLLEPDLVVVRTSGARGRRLSGLPVLVAEVLSPSTRAVDRVLKPHVLEEAGVPSYWLVDPDEPELTVLELVDGTYSQVAHVVGDQEWTAWTPFPVRVVPGELARLPA